jgi:hypothetical protein
MRIAAIPFVAAVLFAFLYVWPTSSSMPDPDTGHTDEIHMLGMNVFVKPWQSTLFWLLVIVAAAIAAYAWWQQSQKKAPKA